jgi:uncharacterized membrane protein (GlpM family)
MVVHAKWSALRQSRWYEYVLRFVLGGLVTTLAGVVAQARGPATGGLFLAFPAIFCASATLIERHERERKQKCGLAGRRRGREAAALDAAGAGLGGIGLVAFALAVWLLAPDFGFVALTVAALAWLLVSITIWRLRREIRQLSS